MAQKVKPIPEGYHTLTPSLIVDGADKAIAFYKKALGAEEIFRMNGADGKTVMHSELKIGDSRFFVSDEMRDMGCQSPKTLGGSPVALFLYVEDVDASFKRALDAGATVRMPVQDMFWGDRYGKLADPFGHEWGMATHKEDVSPEEMRKRGEAAMAEMGKKTG
jgi:PhnB protein